MQPPSPLTRLAAVGFLSGNTAFDFGGQNITPAGAADNAALIQYALDGRVASASSTSLAPAASRYLGVAFDSTGTAAASGFQDTNATFVYGSALNLQGPYGAGNNAILVKYQ